MGAIFEHSFTARADDIDIMGHVNNAVWVRWMEETATAHWTSLAPPEHLTATIWLVTRHEIDYRGNVKLGETVTAQTWVDEPPRGARFERLIQFIGPDGAVKVNARTHWAMIDAQSRRIRRVPPNLAAIFLA